MGESFHGEICHQARKFSVKGAPVFAAFYKKRSDIKYIKNEFFFN